MNTTDMRKLNHSLLWLGFIAVLAGQQPLAGQESNKNAAATEALPESAGGAPRPSPVERTLDDFRKALKAKGDTGTSDTGTSEMGAGVGSAGEMEGQTPMGSMTGGIGMMPELSEKQLLAQLVHQLRERLKSKKHDRQLIEKQLRVALQQYFDADMEERVKELDKVKARLAETESKLQRRLNSDQDIIELQLKQMIHKADGLDFSIPNGNADAGRMSGMGMDNMGGMGMGGVSGMFGAEGAAYGVTEQPLGYDTNFGLTRVQRLDGEALEPEDPLAVYMKKDLPKVDGGPNQSNAKKLEQILLAFHGFEQQFHHMPRSANRHTQNQPPHSWRVAILPLVGYGNLYNEYKFDQPWDSPENLRVASKMPALYRSSNSKSKDSTPFQMLVGEGAFDSTSALPVMSNITDGTSNTIALIDCAHEVFWTKPEDFSYHVNGFVQLSDSRLVGMVDGQVRALPINIDLQQLRALVSRAGGEIVDLP